MIGSATPDLVEPIEAWRAWRVCVDHLEPPRVFRLRAARCRDERPWPPRKADPARCFLEHGSAPLEGCTCGYYAYKDLDGLRAGMRRREFWPVVIGRVVLWGKVIVAERGYRAQYAYPKELYVGPGLDIHFDRRMVLDGLASYGVPVGTFEELGFETDRPVFHVLKRCQGSKEST